MSILDEIHNRGIKTIFSEEFLYDESKYEGIDQVVFVTEADGVKTRGYDAKTTLFIVSPFHAISRDRMSTVRTVLTFLHPTKEIIISLKDYRITIK